MALDPDVQMWATAISTNAINSRKIIFRYAKQLSATFDRASQPIRIIIVWKYRSDSGLPNAEDHQRMNLFEDNLESVLNGDRFATLAMVSTGENLREWTYYARSENEFMVRLNHAFAGMQAFPIETYIACDSSWEKYDQFKAGVKDVAS
jgi:Family of unknown function (DUF695)